MKLLMSTMLFIGVIPMAVRRLLSHRGDSFVVIFSMLTPVYRVHRSLLIRLIAMGRLLLLWFGLGSNFGRSSGTWYIAHRSLAIPM